MGADSAKVVRLRAGYNVSQFATAPAGHRGIRMEATGLRKRLAAGTRVPASLTGGKTARIKPNWENLFVGRNNP